MGDKKEFVTVDVRMQALRDEVANLESAIVHLNDALLPVKRVEPPVVDGGKVPEHHVFAPDPTNAPLVNEIEGIIDSLWDMRLYVNSVREMLAVASK